MLEAHADEEERDMIPAPPEVEITDAEIEELGNKMMAIVNADTGRVIATSPIGQGVDANAFDPETAFAFASNGEGTITVVHEESPEKFTVVDNVPTKRSARTMGLDLKTHNIFLSAADFDAPAPGERRGKMKPHSFVLLVVTRE